MNREALLKTIISSRYELSKNDGIYIL